MDVLLPLLTLILGVALGAAAVLLMRREPPTGSEALDQAVIRDGLDRLHERMRDLEHQRVSWQSTLHQQVDEVRHTTDSLRRETASLTTALRTPHVRGQWGELHLRRTVEIAGLVEHCDFTTQVHLTGDDGAGAVTLRPDLVVHLAGGRSIVVDAKVPLAGYLDAVATLDPDEHRAALARHARHLRTHIDQLGAKAYWRALDSSPEFVVLFVPSEASLAAALDAAPDLLLRWAAASRLRPQAGIRRLPLVDRQVRRSRSPLPGASMNAHPAATSPPA